MCRVFQFDLIEINSYNATGWNMGNLTNCFVFTNSVNVMIIQCIG